MTRIISTTLFFICCYLSAPAQSSENLFDYQHSIKFANYLYNSNQYNLAAEEFERIHFLRPSDTMARIMLLKSYRKAKNLEAGIKSVTQWEQEARSLSRPVTIEYSKTLMLASRFDLARQYFAQNSTLQKQDQTFLQLNSYLLQNDFQQAQQLFSTSFEHLPEGSFNTYNDLIAQGLDMKLKSPAWAAIMSGIIPGTGRLYTGDWKDGLISMLMISSVGYGSYRAFAKRGTQSALGWIYGTLGLGLYLGNIYGTYQSAIDYNTAKRNAFEEKVRDRIDPYF